MDKISTVTQELVNVFPEWSKIRTDKQSVGYQVLNSAANAIENMAHSLNKMNHNNHLTTANLQEPSLLYKIYLKTYYTFTEKYEAGILTGYVTPTVTANTGAISVKNTEDGSFDSFWNDSLPDRISIGTSSTLSPISIVNQNVSTFLTTQTYPINHHLTSGGKFYFILDVEKPYIRQEGNKLKRARVRIEGKTSKGTLESETLTFPWLSLGPTKKSWEYLTSIRVFDEKDTGLGVNTLSVYSDLVGQEDYLSLSNLRVSTMDRKIDEFWGLLTFDNNSYLERAEYITDDFFRLITENSEKVTKSRWLLQDVADNSLSIIDIALIPFRDEFWAVSSSKLFLYSLVVENYSNLDKVRTGDNEAEVTIKFENPDIITNEFLDLKVWHERQMQEITKLHVYCVKPNGLNTDFTNGFIDYTGTDQLIFSKKVEITQEGEYAFYAIVEFEDGTTHTDCRLFKNQVKTPLKEFTLSGIGGGQTIQGLYYDCNQRLLLKTSGGGNFYYYEVTEHKDIMLIDYDRSIIYFHEKYSEVTCV